MGDIKSAWEIAMEKVDAIGKASEEERRQWQYVPEGEKLAARYLKEDLNLNAEIEKFPVELRRYVASGVSEVLIRNLALPRTDLDKKTNKRAMDGLKDLKRDKVATENALSRIRRVFAHFLEQGEQQRKQAYAGLKANMEVKLQQALKQQYGTTNGLKFDVEKQPQFQEEWRKVQAQLDSQYNNLLEEYKKELAEIN